ncbi:MAG: GFA family protein, partial [Burkholderiales bacterium]|nr:GFA family protein [Burkholderiales bacterium]
EASMSIQGDVTYYDHIADSGNRISRAFCPICGSQLFAKLELMPGIIGLRAGTLDEPQHFQPKIDIFTASANHWDTMDPALPKFPKSPRA